jgi:RNA polymerase sigma factor (sigma-70 family)
MVERPLTAGQRAAMADLTRELGADLRRRIARKVPVERVDDIYQQTLLEAAIGLGRLADPSKLHAFVARIAERRIVDAFRSREKHGGIPLDALEWVSRLCTPPSQSPSHEVATKEMTRLVREAVAELKDEDRQIVELFASGLPSADIAARMGHPTDDGSGVRHRLQAILKQLRTRINGGGE